MSNLDDLAAEQKSEQDPIAAAEQMGAILDLPSVGVGVRGARIVGRGGSASVDLYLTDKTEITFPTLKDFAHLGNLALEITACTGARPVLKPPQRLLLVSLLRTVAEHYTTMTTDELSAEWGTAFLQSATTIHVDMNDQLSRYRAFCTLEQSNARVEAQHGLDIATVTTVLVHTDGTRYVRCGWFRAYAKSEDANVSPQEIAHRMERVGWERRGTRGKIKATNPTGGPGLSWAFYVIPKGWEDER
jgi:hypothetical protein